jgi:hypothetical protein
MQLLRRWFSCWNSIETADERVARLRTEIQANDEQRACLAALDTAGGKRNVMMNVYLIHHDD